MKISRFKLGEFGLLLILLLGCAGMAWADPPTRVGRLNYLSGAVSFAPGGVDQWVNATLNYPLTTGDRLWTDAGARAGMHIGSTAVRMDQSTELDVLNLDDRTVQLRLPQGTINARLQNFSTDQRFEVSTPTAAVSLLRPGWYRVEVDGEGTSTRVKVLAGAAEVTSSNAVFTVQEGQVVLISGSNYNIGSAGSPDAFDDWGMARDRREEEQTRAAYHYVSPAMTGAEDLDAYGTWRVEPDYGPVWVPAVAAGWAPYRSGHWAWVGPWGWTWIDDAPWGFAPSHYGRWAYIGEHWAWVPGAPAAAPVYAPALVAFIGGASLTVGVAAEPVGWCPLGPGEWYIPHYHVSDTYIRNINITHVTNVTNVNIVKNIQVNPVNYINSNAPGGVTVVSRNVIVNAQPVANALVPITRPAIAQAKVVGMTAPLAPRLESVLAHPTGSARNALHPPITVAQRPVIARLTPPPAKVPFQVQQPLLAAHPGQPLNPATLEHLHSRATVTSPPVKVVVPPARASSSSVPSSPRQGPSGSHPGPAPEGQNTLPSPQRLLGRPETGHVLVSPVAPPAAPAPHPQPGSAEHRAPPPLSIPQPATDHGPVAPPAAPAPHPQPGPAGHRAPPPLSIPQPATGHGPVAPPAAPALHPQPGPAGRQAPPPLSIPQPATGHGSVAPPAAPAPHPQPGPAGRQATPPHPAAHPDHPVPREMAPPGHQPEIRHTTPPQPAVKKPPGKQPIPGDNNEKHVPE